MAGFIHSPLIWTSPSGKEFEFTYDGVITDGVTHNLAEFSFANVDDSYFQDRTITHDDYPFKLYLFDTDTLRTFRTAIEEKVTSGNPGKLQHPDPTIGTFNCVVSSVKFEQNDVKGKGVCTVSIVFHRQIKDLLAGDTSESATPASATSVYNAASELNEKQAEAFAATIDTSKTAGVTALINSARNSVNKIKDTMSSLSRQVDEANTLFTNTYASILSDIDSIATAPLTLVQQIQTLVTLPALASDSVSSRIASYKKLCDSVLGTSLSGSTDSDTSNNNGFSDTDNTNISKGSAEGKNVLAVAGLVALAAANAICYSAATGESLSESDIINGTVSDMTDKYLSRLDIAKTIADLQNIFHTIINTLSSKAENFGMDDGYILFFDQYFDYSVLNKSILANTIKNLNNRLISAGSEKIYVTERDMNIVPLCYAVYGVVNINTIQFLMATNKLHGNMIYIVPKGTEIKYY